MHLHQTSNGVCFFTCHKQGKLVSNLANCGVIYIRIEYIYVFIIIEGNSFVEEEREN